MFGMAGQLAMTLLKDSMRHYHNPCKPFKYYYKYHFYLYGYVIKHTAAVSCSPVPYRLGGVGFLILQ